MFEIKKYCFYKKHKEKRIYFQNKREQFFRIAIHLHCMYMYITKKNKQTTKVNIQNKKQCIGHDWEDNIACEQ